MGNVIAKHRTVKWVDGGCVKEIVNPHASDLESEAPLFVDAWGCPIKPPKDYQEKVIKQLIRRRRLAPFYEGAVDAPDASSSSSGEEDADSATTSMNGGRKPKIKRNKRNRDDPKFEESSFFKEDLMMASFVECPICLLAYPRNINYTECCHQPLCTSCFVKLKRPSSGRVISCPFCVHANFSVCYHKPRWLRELEKPESDRDASIKPEPVACESIKASEMIQERIRQFQRLQQQHHHHQQNRRQTRYYYISRDANGQPQQPEAESQPRRYVFYEPSGAYTFYDNQLYRTPAYYQHYQQQQSQQGDVPEVSERSQIDEAIRQSLLDSSRAAQEYTRMHAGSSLIE